jgi:hypothetical protein
MEKNSIWFWFTFIFLALIGFWLLIKMVRAYRISGFRFYLYSGLLFGLPFIIWSIIFYYYPQYGIIPFIFVLITTRIGQEWGNEQEEKASQVGSIQWKEYQNKVSKQSRISRILF